MSRFQPETLSCQAFALLFNPLGGWVLGYSGTSNSSFAEPHTVKPHHEQPSQPLVYVLDDQAITAFGYAELLKDLMPGVRVRQFATFKEAAGAAVHEFPVLILSSFPLHDVGPESFLGLLSTLFPGVTVVITHYSAELMQQLRRHEAEHVFITSRTAPLRKLTEVITLALAHAGVSVGSDSTPAPRELTHKQEQVLELIASGLSNKDIARVLQIGVETVKGHVKDILERLHARNRLEATVIFRRAQRQAWAVTNHHEGFPRQEQTEPVR